MSCDMGRLCRAIWRHRPVHRGRAEPGLRQLQWVRAERWGRAVCWNRGSQRGLRASQQCSRAGLLQLPSLQQHSCRLELLYCTNHRHFIHRRKPRYHSGPALIVQFYRPCTLCIVPVACTNPGTVLKLHWLCHLLERLDLKYMFPRIHRFTELGKMPGSWRYCVRYSMQSSKGCGRLHWLCEFSGHVCHVLRL